MEFPLWCNTFFWFEAMTVFNCCFYFKVTIIHIINTLIAIKKDSNLNNANTDNFFRYISNHMYRFCSQTRHYKNIFAGQQKRARIKGTISPLTLQAYALFSQMFLHFMKIN